MDKIIARMKDIESEGKAHQQDSVTIAKVLYPFDQVIEIFYRLIPK